MGNDEVSTNNNGQERFVPATTLDEVMNIAIANGYEGAYPNNIADAVAALGTVVSGGGGAAGYDVTITKVWAVPEQTVTSREITLFEGTEDEFTFWGADVTVGDLAQMLEDGQTALALVVDGTEYAATLAQMPAPSGTAIGIMQDGTLSGYVVNPLDESTYFIGQFSDTEPTAHTVSCYYEDVDTTTTEEFDIAVGAAVEKGSVLLVMYLVGLDGTTVTADKTPEEIYEARQIRHIPVFGILNAAGIEPRGPFAIGMPASADADHIDYQSAPFFSIPPTMVGSSPVLNAQVIAYSYETDTIRLVSNKYTLTPAS